MVVPVALLALALTDAAFCGFRSAAGRSLLLHKHRLFARALVGGAGIGLIVSGIVGAFIAVAMATSGDPAALWQGYIDAGRRMLWWYVPYATVVVATLAFYGSAIPEWRAVATTIVLGPLTLARPLLILAGAAHALLPPTPWVVRASVLLAALLMLPVGRIQDRRYRTMTPFDA